MTRFGWAMATYFSALAVSALAFFPPAPRLIWNATASTPVGLYELQPAGDLYITELVAVAPPEPVAAFLAERGFLPKGVPLLKHVMGLPGQIVCRRSRTVTVDGVVIGEARERDSRGRDLPAWSGCRTIGPDEIFLMNPDIQDSLDGRYFGPIPASSIIGRATPLWTDEESDGHHEWRAATH
ncbi:S26 family signal peptidase [Methylocella tundrae]|uniref:S26 family signal peptidase n=1 Tax=Methylocella tundrae TaxID=227605 RepID=A0A8B6M6X9_METTU|nr:S26 family signal peptidase [Methylocella tundrae]VTZ26126.1 S26 family signal peptidase [Methylocella tundrae]VTZ50508.1 S26 family signal peptidase [Methylocella tundrae]